MRSYNPSVEHNMHFVPFTYNFYMKPDYNPCVETKHVA